MGVKLITVEAKSLFHTDVTRVGLFPPVPPEVARGGAGQWIELRRPDGSKLVTSIERFDTCYARAQCIVLPSGVTYDDVPVGTEVWLVDAPLDGGAKQKNQ